MPRGPRGACYRRPPRPVPRAVRRHSARARLSHLRGEISAASRATKLAVFVLPAARRPPQLRKSIPKYTRKDFKDGKELDEDAFRKLILAVKTGALIEDVQKSDEEIRALFNKVTDCH